MVMIVPVDAVTAVDLNALLHANLIAIQHVLVYANKLAMLNV